jgi:hypothetical protein
VAGATALALCAAVVLFGIVGLASAEARVRPQVRTDGTLTVGGQERLTVSHVPRVPHRKLKASIVAPIAASICNHESLNLGFFEACLPQPLYPVAGTPRFKANKKDRASLTFVMPPAYEFIDFSDPTRSHPITLVDGQTIGVEIDIAYKPRSGGSAIASLAFGSAVVEVPAPPSP